LGGRKGIRPVKTEWWGTGMVICRAAMGTEFLSPYPLHTQGHGDPHTHGKPGYMSGARYRLA